MLYTCYICICIGCVLLLAMPSGTYMLCVYRHICMYVLLMFTEAIQVWHCYYPHFTNEGTEAQGGQETVWGRAGIQTQANWPGGGGWGKCISVFAALSTSHPTHQKNSHRNSWEDDLRWSLVQVPAFPCTASSLCRVSIATSSLVLPHNRTSTSPVLPQERSLQNPVAVEIPIPQLLLLS